MKPSESKAEKVLYEFATWARHAETKEVGVHVSMKLNGASRPTAIFFDLKAAAKLLLASQRAIKESLAQLPKEELLELEAFVEHEVAVEKFLGRVVDVKRILTGG